MKPRILSKSIGSQIASAAIVLAIVGSTSHGGQVVFSPAGTATADTDVFTGGNFLYAYTQSNAAATLNGVTFAAGTSATTLGGGNVTLGGFNGGANTTAFTGGASNPWNLLSAGYKSLLTGAAYTAGATTATVTANNLVAGHNYAVQVWVNDARAGGTATRTETVTGANTVLLDYNSTNAGGGVGQYATGYFLADATSQSISLLGNASTQMNGIQVREVTNLGFWTGTNGATWDAATTANFATNFYSAPLATGTFAAAKAPLAAVTFGDSYWDNSATVSVAQTAVNIATGGVTTGRVIFQNATSNYTVSSSDALGITGATIVAVVGGGTVTLNGTHSYTGATVVSNGTLKSGSATTFNNTSALEIGGSTGILDMNGNNGAFTAISGVAGGTLTDNAGTAGTTTLSMSAAGITPVKILNGASRTIALRITNQNGGFALTNGANTFSGGIVLTNSAGGTRMSPGTITAGAYGTGTITVGEAATDKAGIFFATASQTLSNNIVANTGLGTDRVGTFRVAAAGITLSGQLTAGLADVTFSTNETGSITATGKITGNNGVKLLSHTLGGTSLTVTLNNAAGTNDYAGNTTINENPQATRNYTLALGAANQIPNGAGKGDVFIHTNTTGVGRLNLNGFSETINGLNGSGTLDGVSGAPVLTVGDNGASGSFSGPIINTAGTLALTKTGNGVQTLGGANTYSGPTSVNAGKLFVNGSLAATSAVSVATGATLGGSGSVPGAVTVSSGATIESGTGTNAGTLTLGALTLGATAGDTSTFNLRPFGSPAVNVTGTDLLVANGGAASSTVNIIGAAPAVGTYTLIDYAGSALSPSAYGSFVLGTLPNRVTATLQDNSGNTSIDLNVSLVDTARWSGAFGSEWSTGSITAPKNWVLNSDGTTGTDYLQNDTVSFTDSATTTVVDVSAANVSPASMTFDHSAKDYTLQGTAAIAGTTGLTKLGTGKLTITNTNSFAGPVLVQRGTVSVASIPNAGVNSPLGTAAQVVLGDVATAGTLEYTGITAATNRTLSLNAGGGIVAIPNAGTTLTLNGVISGAGAFTKTGSGTLELNGGNTFTGGLVVAAGIVRPLNDTALGPVGSLVSVTSGGTLDINSRTLQGYTQNIAIAGAGADASLGALGNAGLTDNLNAIRGITLTGDASIGGNGGRWDIGRLDFNADPAIAVNHIDGGGFTLTKVGSGQLGLLTGATNLAAVIVNGGIIAPHENTSFGTGPVTVNNGATIRPWGTNITLPNNITINAGTLLTDGQNNFYTGTITAAGPTTFTTATGGNININGVLTGAGAITKNGPFSVLLGGDSTGYTGTYTNAESNTFFNGPSSASASASFVLNAGIIANTFAGTVTHNLGSFAGTGGTLGNNVAASSATFSIGENDASTTFAGTIVDSVGGGGTTAITKVGDGVLTLTGVNTYTGPTNVVAGTLLINGSITGSVTTVSAGGTLGGSGTLGPVNVASGGILSPGNSPGILNTGALVLSAGSTLSIEINGTTAGTGHDQINVAGIVDITDSTLSLSVGYSGFGDLFTILLNNDTDPVVGTFTGLPEGALFQVGAQQFNISYTGGDGNDIVLASVPEPGSALLMLGGLATLFARRRRMRA